MFTKSFHFKEQYENVDTQSKANQPVNQCYKNMTWDEHLHLPPAPKEYSRHSYSRFPRKGNQTPRIWVFGTEEIWETLEVWILELPSQISTLFSSKVSSSPFLAIWTMIKKSSTANTGLKIVEEVCPNPAAVQSFSVRLGLTQLMRSSSLPPVGCLPTSCAPFDSVPWIKPLRTLCRTGMHLQCAVPTATVPAAVPPHHDWELPFCGVVFHDLKNVKDSAQSPKSGHGSSIPFTDRTLQLLPIVMLLTLAALLCTSCWLPFDNLTRYPNGSWEQNQKENIWHGWMCATLLHFTRARWRQSPIPGTGSSQYSCIKDSKNKRCWDQLSTVTGAPQWLSNLHMNQSLRPVTLTEFQTQGDPCTCAARCKQHIVMWHTESYIHFEKMLSIPTLFFFNLQLYVIL